jgi:hypothetical protein
MEISKIKEEDGYKVIEGKISIFFFNISFSCSFNFSGSLYTLLNELSNDWLFTMILMIGYQVQHKSAKFYQNPIMEISKIKEEDGYKVIEAYHQNHRKKDYEN